MIQNSRGKRFYGLHFYPGLAEYQEPGKDPYRVFLNEDTLRSMDASFEGRPVFVEHVDGVDPDVDELRKDADGWVLRSFYNEADGKHWAEFIVCSERGLRAISNGMRLSNCYEPKQTTHGGLWNGIPFHREITAGEYEHLAIVANPRYDESVIMTPEQFKVYNEEKLLDLKRMSNEKEGTPMLEFFTKKIEKLKNSADLEGTLVVLPKSKREVSIAQLVNEMDLAMVEKKEPQMANGDHMIDYDGEKMTVNDLMSKHAAMCQELADYKKNDSAVTDEEVAEPAAQPTQVSAENAEEPKKNDDEEEGKPKKKTEVMGVRGEKDDKEKDDDKKRNDLDVARAAKKAKDKDAADKLRNAESDAIAKALKQQSVEIIGDKVARGKSRYGSN